MAYLLKITALFLLDLAITRAQRVIIDDLNPCTDVINCQALPHNYRIAYPGDCTRFYACVGGELKNQTCDRGLFFDEFLRECKEEPVLCAPPCDDEDGTRNKNGDSQPLDGTNPTTPALTTRRRGLRTPPPPTTTPRGATWGRLPIPSTPRKSESRSPRSTQNPLPGTTTTTTTATTPAPSNPVERCAPPRDACPPGETFGYANDCSRYYECMEPQTPDGPYYRFQRCWSNQGFDIVERRCLNAPVARCEENCPARPYVATTTAPALTTAQNTTVSEIVTSVTQSSDVTPTSPPIQNNTGTTTPRLHNPVEQCAPPRSACTPGERFGYVEDCTMYYVCIGNTMSKIYYYNLLECGLGKAFDVYSRACERIEDAVCETHCPGFIRTTHASITTDNITEEATTEGYSNNSTLDYSTDFESSTEFESTSSGDNFITYTVTYVYDETTSVDDYVTTGDFTTSGMDMITSEEPDKQDNVTTTPKLSTMDNSVPVSSVDFTTMYPSMTETTLVTTVSGSDEITDEYGSGSNEMESGEITDSVPVTTTKYTSSFTTTSTVAIGNDSLTTVPTPEQNGTTVTLTNMSTEGLLISTIGGVSVESTTESYSVTSTTDMMTSVTQNATALPVTTTTSPLSSNITTDAVTEVNNEENTTISMVTTPRGEQHETTSVTQSVTVTSSTDMMTSSIHVDNSSMVPSEETTSSSMITPSSTDATTRGVTTQTNVTDTTTSTGIPLSTACNKRDPCVIGHKVADPENCTQYYMCTDDFGWFLDSCQGLQFDVNDGLCKENATCSEPCSATTETSTQIPVTSAQTTVTSSEASTTSKSTMTISTPVSSTENPATAAQTSTVSSSEMTSRYSTMSTSEISFTSESSPATEQTRTQTEQMNTQTMTDNATTTATSYVSQFDTTPGTMSVPSGMTTPEVASTTTTTPSVQYGEIQDLVITMLSPDALEGEVLQAECSFGIYPPVASFTLIWKLDGSPIRPSDSGRIHITDPRPLSTTSTTYASVFTFDPVYAQDSGMLSCYVELTDGSDADENELQLNVLALPTTTLTPMTVTLQLGEQLRLLCVAGLEETGHPADDFHPSILWYRDGVLVTDEDEEDIINSQDRSELTIYPQNDVMYSCAGRNGDINMGEGPWSNSSVYVIDENEPMCEQETIDDIVWTETVVGVVNVQQCPEDMIGSAKRACVPDGDGGAIWEEPNLVDCVDEAFMDISQQISQLEDGIGGPEVSEDIAEALQEITNTSDALPAGDINSAVDSMDALAEIRWDASGADLSETEMMSMMETVSNLISEMNEEPWEQVLKEYPNKAVSLMQTVDRYGDIFADQLDVNETMNLVTSMLVVQVEALSKEHTRDLRYPDTEGWTNDEQVNDVIMLDKDTLDQIAQKLPGDKISVSSSYYRSLNKLLPSYSNASEGYIGSRVLAASVGMNGHSNLDPPVQMSFTHDELPEDKEAKCSYWDYDSMMWSTDGCHVIKSNSTQTTCECDHLTNFAILVSRKPLTGKHAYVLGIISIVGCVISIAGLFLTILIYISIWKHVKSHHAVVLINLCIALLVANLLFVTGVDKAEHEDLCTAIAALLHYFYLAAFCIMLVEGVQLVLYIIYVFHVRRKRETAFMLILAWVVPAAVVGICLGISQTDGYGTEDYCWLDPGSWLFWAFIVPVIIIIIINVGILVAVLRRISASKMHQVDKNRNQRIRSGAWNIVVIMPILGITWIFGIFSLNSDIIAFQYIFAIANSLQGLFIFIFHAICNKKKGNYQVKTTSQRTHRSRLKSDSSGKNSSKLDKNITKGFLGKKIKRQQSTENPYDTIPAEYVPEKPTNGKLAVENEYSLPEENRMSCFDNFMLPEENTFQKSNGINHNPFDTYIVPEEKQNNRFEPGTKPRHESEDSYMVPISQQGTNGGFANPAFIPQDITGHDQIGLSFSNGRNIQDTSFSNNNNKAIQGNNVNIPKNIEDSSFNNPVFHDSTVEDASFNTSIMQDNAPPHYEQLQHINTPPGQNTPPSYHASLQRGAIQNPSIPRDSLRPVDSTQSLPRGLRNVDSDSSLKRDLIHTDSNSSFHRGLIQTDSNSSLKHGLPRTDYHSLQRRADLSSSLQRTTPRKVEEMRPDECIDMNLRKQDSPRHTPRSSPYLPRSTPFLSKHGGQQ